MSCDVLSLARNRAVHFEIKLGHSAIRNEKMRPRGSEPKPLDDCSAPLRLIRIPSWPRARPLAAEADGGASLISQESRIQSPDSLECIPGALWTLWTHDSSLAMNQAAALGA